VNKNSKESYFDVKVKKSGIYSFVFSNKKGKNEE